jgi:hypothetical protein
MAAPVVALQAKSDELFDDPDYYGTPSGTKALVEDGGG